MLSVMEWMNMDECPCCKETHPIEPSQQTGKCLLHRTNTVRPSYLVAYSVRTCSRSMSELLHLNSYTLTNTSHGSGWHGLLEDHTFLYSTYNSGCHPPNPCDLWVSVYLISGFSSFHPRVHWIHTRSSPVVTASSAHASLHGGEGVARGEEPDDLVRCEV